MRQNLNENDTTVQYINTKTNAYTCSTNEYYY